MGKLIHINSWVFALHHFNISLKYTGGVDPSEFLDWNWVVNSAVLWLMVAAKQSLAADKCSSTRSVKEVKHKTMRITRFYISFCLKLLEASCKDLRCENMTLVFYQHTVVDENVFSGRICKA